MGSKAPAKVGLLLSAVMPAVGMLMAGAEGWYENGLPHMVPQRPPVRHNKDSQAPELLC